MSLERFSRLETSIAHGLAMTTHTLSIHQRFGPVYYGRKRRRHISERSCRKALSPGS